MRLFCGQLRLRDLQARVSVGIKAGLERDLQMQRRGRDQLEKLNTLLDVQLGVAEVFRRKRARRRVSFHGHH